MPSLTSYIIGGVLVVLAMDFLAPPAGIGLALGAWPDAAAVRQETAQQINRVGKSDRQQIERPATSVEEKRPAKPAPRVLVGCDPAFSPLAASARLNFASRCMA